MNKHIIGYAVVIGIAATVALAQTVTFPGTDSVMARTDAGQSFDGTQAFNDVITLGPNPAPAGYGYEGDDNYYFRAGKDANGFNGGVFTNFSTGVNARVMVSAMAHADGSHGVNLVQYGVNNTTHGWSTNAAAVVAESNVSKLALATNGASPVRFVPQGVERGEFNTNGQFVVMSGNVNQPAINLAPSYAFGSLGNSSGKDGAGGGLNLMGFSATDERGLFLQGIIGVTDPSDSMPAVAIRGSKSDGAGDQDAMGASETVFAIQNNKNAYGFRMDGANNVSIAGNLKTNVTGGGTQCLQATNDGTVVGSGAGCAGGGGLPRNSYYNGTEQTPSGTSSTSVVMMGMGTAWTLTPAVGGSGCVKITITGSYTSVNAGAALGDLQIVYGTGTAPSNGASSTGTGAGMPTNFSPYSNVAGVNTPITLNSEVCGLTAVPHWFDVRYRSAAAGGLVTIKFFTTSIEEVR